MLSSIFQETINCNIDAARKAAHIHKRKRKLRVFMKEMVSCKWINKKLIVTFAYLSILLIFAICYNSLSSTKYSFESNQSIIWTKHSEERENKENILDGCYHVYLDVGSNIGVQIRKLFEPKLYPNAHVHPVFNSNFGAIGERMDENYPFSICAVGFEPNPRHTKYLKEIEASYNKCGWKVKFFTETAVSNYDGTTKFYSDADNKHLQWGSGILPPDLNSIAWNRSRLFKNQTPSTVNVISLRNFLQNVVGKRKIPSVNYKSVKPKVVMKMDVEGSEVDIIPDLLFRGGLEHVNNLMLEWHRRLEVLPDRRKAQEYLEEIIPLLDKYATVMSFRAKAENTEYYDFKLETVDDERYFNSTFKLPKC